MNKHNYRYDFDAKKLYCINIERKIPGTYKNSSPKRPETT